MPGANLGGVTKTCSRCIDDKDLEEFYTHPDNPDGRRGVCKACMKTGQSAYEKTPTRKSHKRVWQREYWGMGYGRQRTLAKYDLTQDAYQALLRGQGGVCAICKKPPVEGESFFPVDHDHETGTVRGILCLNCNTGLGKFKDNCEFLASAILYLKGTK